MVISGGDFKPDTLKPKEMVSLLLDDDEMETRCKLIILSYSTSVVYLHDNLNKTVMILFDCSFGQAGGEEGSDGPDAASQEG
jgi:hypothetical protein